MIDDVVSPDGASDGPGLEVRPADPPGQLDDDSLFRGDDGLLGFSGDLFGASSIDPVLPFVGARSDDPEADSPAGHRFVLTDAIWGKATAPEDGGVEEDLGDFWLPRDDRAPEREEVAATSWAQPAARPTLRPPPASAERIRFGSKRRVAAIASVLALVAVVCLVLATRASEGVDAPRQVGAAGIGVSSTVSPSSLPPAPSTSATAPLPRTAPTLAAEGPPAPAPSSPGTTAATRPTSSSPAPTAPTATTMVQAPASAPPRSEPPATTTSVAPPVTEPSTIPAQETVTTRRPRPSGPATTLPAETTTTLPPVPTTTTPTESPEP